MELTRSENYSVVTVEWFIRMACTLSTMWVFRAVLLALTMTVFMMQSRFICFKGQADSVIFFAMVEAGTDLSTLHSAFTCLAVVGANIWAPIGQWSDLERWSNLVAYVMTEVEQI